MTLALPASALGNRRLTGMVRSTGTNRSLSVALPAELERLPIDEAVALLARQQWLTARPAQHWQYVARRLHQHRGNAVLRSRAAGVVDLFTGSGVGVIAALWTQEREQQRAQTRVQAATCWSQLRAGTHPGSVVDALRTIREADARLRELDRIDRVISAGEVLALSPAAAARIVATAAGRPATDRLHPEVRPQGFGWLPHRRSFVGWLADQQGTEVFEIGAAEMAAWVRRLRGPDPQILTWSRTELPQAATDLTPEHRQLAAEIGELRRLRFVPVQDTDDHGWRWTRRAAPVDDAPVTHLVVTAAESTEGLSPFDLGTGSVADAGWRKARWRQMWQPESGRSVRTWTDATRAADRIGAPHRTAVSLLPLAGGRVARVANTTAGARRGGSYVR